MGLVGFRLRVSRLAGGVHVPFTVPFSFPVISHLASRQVCKMMEMVIELHVKKTKQMQDYTAGPEFNLEKDL